jgi:hypothetical protein
MAVSQRREMKALVDLPEGHPAKLAFLAHVVCRRDCVGKELGDTEEAFDQEWYSEIEGRRRTFSGFAYAFISYNLTPQNLLKHPKQEDESQFIDRLNRQRALLSECEVAAKESENHRVLACIEKIRKFFDLWEQAIILRRQ